MFLQKFPVFLFLFLNLNLAFGFWLTDKIFGLDKLSSNPEEIGFYLYSNPRNPYDYDFLDYPDISSFQRSRLKPKAPLIILTHGFTQNYTSDFPVVIKNAYLKAGFAGTHNIIAVDWGKLSGPRESSSIPLIGNLLDYPIYIKAVDNTKIVGHQINGLLNFLIEYGYLQGPEDVHLIGQSLGAHASGFAGKYFHESTDGKKKLRRITGTDPAGPNFQYSDETERLDSSDAHFVDIVHTNTGVFGFDGILGHVDFYMNGQTENPLIQPVCKAEANSSDLFCSHNTAPHYYAKSILDPQILGYPILDTIETHPGPIVFGENCPENSRGQYTVIIKYDETP